MPNERTTALTCPCARLSVSDTARIGRRLCHCIPNVGFSVGNKAGEFCQRLVYVMVLFKSVECSVNVSEKALFKSDLRCSVMIVGQWRGLNGWGSA